jgi:hypothetical protein
MTSSRLTAARIRLFESMAPGRARRRASATCRRSAGSTRKMFVGEVLQFFGELRGLPGAEAIARADRWLERLGPGRVAQEPGAGPVQGNAAEGAVRRRAPARAGSPHPRRAVERLDPINAEVLHEVVRSSAARAHHPVLDPPSWSRPRRCATRSASSRAARRSSRGRSIASSATPPATGWWRRFPRPERRRRRPASWPTRAGGRVRDRRGYLEVELAPGRDSSQLLSRLVRRRALRRFELIEPTLHQIFVDRGRGRGGRRQGSRRERTGLIPALALPSAELLGKGRPFSMLLLHTFFFTGLLLGRWAALGGGASSWNC